ncbi:hypothetical protein CAY60_020530 [Shouchella clausii]|jgi:hypothetical protein|uniref:Uncharacterized protein n=3 Tax=Shouchella TaxID=2893057 RepID=Q5WJQ4_SHOC1|nr:MULTISPECIES: hypothetical protein [Shouchella]MCM3314235.1 hypothetical protein [Psychrobacillus sp. MER TA 17]ALA51972.1 hypothetical protein DB29_01144 [Shouchella clausii]MBU3230576.1 hypothetical protein [Shouchella clausii]MBU3262225.1 hypothetical protein [Shouchella clausii]MBU3507460.1 hypothetical protein [Shouchella clausii]
MNDYKRWAFQQCPQQAGCYRQFPPVDTTELTESVHQFEFLLKQGQLLLHQLGNRPFAKHLMEAAQKSDHLTVQHMIQSVPGLTAVNDIKFSPTGIVFQLASPVISEGGNCCAMSIVLKWG